MLPYAYALVVLFIYFFLHLSDLCHFNCFFFLFCIYVNMFRGSYGRLATAAKCAVLFK